MKKLVVLCLTFLTSFGAFTQSMSDEIERGIALHNSALTQGEATTAECLNALRPFIEKSMVARAYYGSAITIQASFFAADNPIKSLSLLEEGARYMDSAVAKESENGELRLIRLSNGVEVSRSSPLKRYDVIADDVRWFEEHEPKPSPEERAAIHYTIGLFYQDAGSIEDALDAFEASVATGVDSEATRDARKILRRYEE